LQQEQEATDHHHQQQQQGATHLLQQEQEATYHHQQQQQQGATHLLQQEQEATDHHHQQQQQPRQQQQGVTHLLQQEQEATHHHHHQQQQQEQLQEPGLQQQWQEQQQEAAHCHHEQEQQQRAEDGHQQQREALVRPIYVAEDANMKLNRFAKCGTAIDAVYRTLQLGPRKQHYLGGPHMRAPEFLENYPSRSRSHAANSRASEDQEEGCTANLTCARPAPPAAKGGVTDIKCTVGGCCAHEMPGKGLFIASDRPENFCLYDLVHAQLLEYQEQGYLPDWKGVGMDTNCQ
jgi:hypothetical protein